MIGFGVDVWMGVKRGPSGPTTPGVLNAGTRNFPVTGTDANLLAGRLLASAAGAFAVTGQDAALTFGGRRLVADTGAFAVTGQDATLAYAPSSDTTTDDDWAAWSVAA